MSPKHGIEYFPQVTDPFRDEKAFALQELAEEAGADPYFDVLQWGRLTGIVYTYGPLVEVTDLRMRKIAHDMHMGREELEAFVGRCAEAELIDRGLWERSRVITSRTFQENWMTAKKRKGRDGLPARMRQWSLLDDDAPEHTDVHPPTPSYTSIHPDTPNPALDKTRRDKKREDEREVVLSGEEGKIVENPAPEGPIVENPATLSQAMETRAGACLSREVGEDTQFLDDEDGLHRTPMGALAQVYPARTGRDDFGQFVGLVSDLCPADCRGDPERERQCFALLERSLRGYDPERGSPWGKARVVLTQDRGW